MLKRAFSHQSRCNRASCWLALEPLFVAVATRALPTVKETDWFLQSCCTFFLTIESGHWQNNIKLDKQVEGHIEIFVFSILASFNFL